MADFPTTRSSALHGLLSDDHSARAHSLEHVANAYFAPIRQYVRRRWKKSSVEAEELAQSFFLRAIDRKTFAAYDPSRGRFRTYVRVCVDNFVLDAERHETVRRRVDQPLQDELGSLPDPETLFAQEWVRSIFERAVESLRTTLLANGKEVHFRTFELFHLATDTDRVSYADAAQVLGITVSDVTNRLSYSRRAFRAIVLDFLREVTASEQELRDEARDVLGVEL